MDLDGLYRDIVETSPDGIWVFDLEGRTVYANPVVADLLGVDAAQALRLTVFDSLDEVGRRQFAEHLEQVRRGHLNEHDVEVRFQRGDGTGVWMLVRESPVLDGSGRLTAVLHRLSDYGDRRDALEQLRTSRAQLSEAHRIARIGSWTYDVLHDEILGSPELYALYGLDPVAFPATYEQFLGIVHPDDRARVDEAVQLALRGAEEFHFEARIEGEVDWVWTRGRGVPRRDASGAVVSMSGTHQDVSESKQAELALQDLVSQNTLLQTVAVASNEARTLDDVLVHARHLVLLHDDWERGRAFVPTDDGAGVVALYVVETDRLEDEASAEETAIELEVANLCFRQGIPVWDARRLTIAFPVSVEGEVCAVLTITSAPPLYRHAMIQGMVQLVAGQLGRVAERERAERALAQARDAAMEASRQKSEFLATMSHEIRTPLNGVIGLNDLLLRCPLDADQQRLSTGVQVASRALLGVINDILDFSKMEAGKMVLERVDFDVRPLLDQVVSVLGEPARAKGLALVVDCHRDVPVTVAGDPTRLMQVLSNLVSNGVKFTERGTVAVHATAEALDEGRTRLRVEVSDTGVGIDTSGPGGIEALFAPFTQADASTTRVYGGTGLGLAIAREIVEALGGTLTYAPRPGGGSVFSFDAVLEHAGGAVVVEAAPVPELAEPGPGRAILVVEDNPVNQLVATGLLESMGYRVEVADDGYLALEALQDARFDAILMDVQMPRMDGYATTRAIREREADRRTPILAMTAAAIDGERERCLEAGMDDFLTKPVDPVSLAAVLSTLFSKETTISASPAPAAPPPAPLSAAATAPPPGTESLDVDRLDMLRDLDEDNTAYLDRAIGNFLANSASATEAMRSAILAGDATALRHVSHKLVGSSLNLGVPDAAAAGRLIEFVADTGTVEGALELLPALEDSLALGRTALLAYQSSYSRGGA